METGLRAKRSFPSARQGETSNHRSRRHTSLIPPTFGGTHRLFHIYIYIRGMLRKSFQNCCASKNLFLKKSLWIRSLSSPTPPSSSSSPTPSPSPADPNEDLTLLYQCDGSRNIRFVALATGINFTV